MCLIAFAEGCLMPETSKKMQTKERIIEVAERLFAEKGLDGTSLRDITEAAGVNLASINYYFRSKDGLIAAVFNHYLVPLNESRLAMLDAVETESAESPPVLETVLEAFIRPAVVRALDCNKDNDSFMRLMGRCLSEPAAYAEKHIRPHFEALMERFNAAVARSEPGLSQDEIFWRMGYVAGTLHYALHLWSSMESNPFRPAKSMDAEGLIRSLVSFAAAGLRSRAANRGGKEAAGSRYR